MKNKEELISKFYYECSCACGELQFTQWKDDGIVFISYNIPAFNAYQRGTWGNIASAIKIIWNVLLGREYRLYEIVIEDNETLRRFKEFVAGMKEIEEDETVT